MSEPPKPAVGNSLIGYIKSLGYPDSSIENKGDFYLVEGDILFTKADSALYISNRGPVTNGRESHEAYPLLVYFEMQHSLDRTVTNQYFASLYVYPSLISSGEDHWNDAINEAIEAWNSVPGCKVLIQRTADITMADIKVNNDGGSLPNEAFAAASYPSNLHAGNSIVINLDAAGNTVLSAGAKRQIFAHELGHTIGFMHTDEPGNHIPNTPYTDYFSLMNKGYDPNFGWIGFTQDDIAAAQELYPNPYKSTLVNIPGNYAVERDAYENIYWTSSLITDPNVEIYTCNVSFNWPARYRTFTVKRTVSVNTPNDGLFENGIVNNLDNSSITGYLQAVKIVSTLHWGQVDFTEPFVRGFD